MAEISKRLKFTIIGEDVEHLELSYPALGMWYGTINLEICLAISLQLKYSPIIKISHSTPRYLPRRNENLFPCKELYKNSYSSFIHTSEKLKTIEVPIS